VYFNGIDRMKRSVALFDCIIYTTYLILTKNILYS
jgi:hypothetical protein